MAITKTKKAHKQDGDNQADKVLPQNFVQIGDRVLDNKNIYISQPAYKAIHKFTKDKTKNESGGMLIGYTIEEFGKTNIVIDGFIEAKHSEGTPTTLTFTHDTWEYVHKELDKKHPEKSIVGWIHTHPNFGIFLSEYDKFIHENFFNQEFQVAYVIDPIQNEEGFYFWINSKIARCPGFYIYDKTGVDIEERKQIESVIEKPKKSSISNTLYSFSLSLLLVVLSVLSVILYAKVLSLQSHVKNNTDFIVIQQQEIMALQSQMDELKQQLGNTDGSTNAAIPDGGSDPEIGQVPLVTPEPSLGPSPAPSESEEANG